MEVFMKIKSVPGAILGIIGAVFAVIGALGYILFADLAAAVAQNTGLFTFASYFLGLGGALAALVGGIICLNKAVIGGIVQAVALVMTLVLCFIMGFGWATILALILIAGGIVCSFFVQKQE